MPDTTTNLPAPRVPMIDERTGFISREWYKFFNNLFTLTGSGRSGASITDVLVELGSATASASLDQLAATEANIQAALVAPPPSVPVNPAYGLFSSSVNQTGGSTTTAYAVTYDTTVLSRGVRVVSNSRLTVSQAGLYQIEVHLNASNSGGPAATIEAWLAKNGTNIPNTGAHVGLAAITRAATDILSYQVAMSDGDYLEVYWRQDNLSATLEAVAAAASPTRPANPSAIVTMSLISSTLY